MTLTDILDNVINLARQDNGGRRLELQNFLKELSAAEVYWIETIMYLGRDSGGVSGIFDQYVCFSNYPLHDARRTILGKASLPNFIEAGIKQLREGGIDIDTLLSTHIDSPLASLNDGSEVILTHGQWICDRCGKIIDKAEDGMLVWLVNRNEDDTKLIYRDIKIVHHMSKSPLGGCYGCYPDEEVEYKRNGSSIGDEHLNCLTGPDGLVRLLAFIEDNHFSTHDISRIIMRIFVPCYEQARPYFAKAIQTGVVDQGLPDDYFFQLDLRSIVANISKLQSIP